MSNRGSNPPSGSSYKSPTTQELQTIIKEDAEVSARKTIAVAEELAKQLVEAKLKAAQIRLIFSKVRQIEARSTASETVATSGASDTVPLDGTTLREILLLKPRISYQSKRTPSLIELERVLIPLIDLVKTRRDFQRFVDFLEAVVAYHKVKGGE